MSTTKHLRREQKVLIHVIGYIEKLCVEKGVDSPAKLNDFTKIQFNELEQELFQPTTTEIIQMTLAICEKYDNPTKNDEVEVEES